MRALTITAGVLLLAAPARADSILSGSIIKVDHQEIYINVGRARGLDDGAELRLKRKVSLRHPITRKPVQDWIPIGAATITQAGDRMSRAVIGELVGAVKVGDLAEAYVVEDVAEPPAPAPAPTPPPAPEPTPESPIDRATRDVLAAFAALSGASLDARIATWERYQSTHPDSPFRAAVDTDLSQLRALRETIAPDPTRITRDAAPVAISHAAPTRTAPATAVPLVFVIDQPALVASGWLHYRAAGERTYRRVLLRREHDRYLRGAIPAAAVQLGAVEYFVEITTPRGDGGVAVATPEQPRRVAIDPPTIANRFEARPGRTELTLSFMYLDFANLDRRDGDRTDREYFAELDVRYRLAEPGRGGLFKAIGAGYGVFAGKGGSDSVWLPDEPIPSTGFNYGYADVEIGGAAGRIPIALAGRVMAGVGKAGFEAGFEVRGRIGADDGTHLSATARNLDTIGFLSDLRLGTRPRPRLPIGVAVGVLDQPAEGDLAVRLGVDAGYVIGPVAPTLRVSWQGRSIDHGGVGGGLALAFRW
jgi:hypothetical protein